MVEGLSCLLNAHTQQATAAEAENWIQFVKKGRPGVSWPGNLKKNCRVIFKITEKCIFLLLNPVLHITKEKWKRFSKLC